jgi:4-hydroxybenzoate polyprenyltransferase
MIHIISDYVTLLRLIILGGLATHVVFGAIIAGVTEYTILLIILLIGEFSVIHGFVLNDSADIEIDKLIHILLERSLGKKQLINEKFWFRNEI